MQFSLRTSFDEKKCFLVKNRCQWYTPLRVNWKKETKQKPLERVIMDTQCEGQFECGIWNLARRIFLGDTWIKTKQTKRLERQSVVQAVFNKKDYLKLFYPPARKRNCEVYYLQDQKATPESRWQRDSEREKKKKKKKKKKIRKVRDATRRRRGMRRGRIRWFFKIWYFFKHKMFFWPTALFLYTIAWK